MKNISLHAPLNNTNRNWERALIKKAKSGGSSTPQKGVYSIELHSFPVDEFIQEVAPEAEPTLISSPEMPNISVYHIKTMNNQAAGYAVLHEFNDLKVLLEAQVNSNNTYQSTVSVYSSYGDTIALMIGEYDNTLNYTSSYEYVKDTYLQDIIADCEYTFIRYASTTGGVQ